MHSVLSDSRHSCRLFSSLVTWDSIPHYILCIVSPWPCQSAFLSSFVNCPHGMRVCRSSAARYVSASRLRLLARHLMPVFSSLVTRDSIPNYILCIVPTGSRRFFLLFPDIGCRLSLSCARSVCRLYMPVFLFLLVPFHS